MDQERILETLDAHDKVHTMAEVIAWRKGVNKKSRREKRKAAIEFFGNEKISKNLLDVEKAINSINVIEKLFKSNLKKKVVEEEFDKCKEVIKTKSNRTKDFKTPPDCYESLHVSRKDSVKQKYQCILCNKEFNSIEKVTEHKDDEKLRLDAWTQLIQEKVEKDKRLEVFYKSRAKIDHLTAETDLPDPILEDLEQGDESMDVSLAHEDHHQSQGHEVILGPSTPKTPRQNIKQVLEEQTQKMKLARQKSKEILERKQARQVRLEVKKKLIQEKETNKENLEIVETDGNIVKVRKTKIIVDKTGKKREQASMKTFVDVTTKAPNKRKANTLPDAAPPKVTPEALRLRAKKMADASKVLGSTKEEEAIVTAKFVDSKAKDELFEQTFKGTSKTFKERAKLTVEEAADEIIATHATRRGVIKRRTILNKINKNIYPSDKKVTEELEKRTKIDMPLCL